MEFEIATLAKFSEQAKSADVIYVRGGKNRKLLEVVKNIPNFVANIKEKVYAGSSAGAHVVSKYFYSRSEDSVIEGLGILPMKVFCHWKEEKKEKLEMLKNLGQDLPIYKIKEGEFVHINK